ncbi:MAG: ATP-binding protein [Elusimicrobiota bacterium]|nr:ATP-binding protein [Elusimicrobiota bacterium]
MAENSFTSAGPLFRKLLMKLVVFHASSFLVFLALAMFIVNNSRTHQAKQFSDSFRDLLVSGDTSQVVVGMSKPVLNDFIGAEWRPGRGTQNFSIPLDFKRPQPYFYKTITISVYYDEGMKIEAGKMYFYYPRGAFLGWAITAWISLVLLSIPLGVAEKNRLVRDYNLLIQSNINESKAVMAAQVAHDIRSPLVALDAALKHAEQLPEKQRTIVRHAVNRIRDIANNLLEKNQQQTRTATTANTAAGGHVAGEPPAVHLLSSLIDPVITEKRLQYESKPGISIDFKLTRESYGLFASLQPVEFRRMLSNLVNNAVEALGDKGAVDVGLNYKDENIVLTVSDNGKGIPPAILAKLGQRGETHGKAGGSGLGLFHARTTAENWGGSLTITSTPGQGTAVTIKLPKAEAPAGFAPALVLPPGRPVVVLDDDATIHQVWQGRFDSARVKEHDIEIIHFSEPDELREWVKADPVKAQKAVCLFDYELLGFKETGLSLAEELDLCSKTILVTSRCGEPRIIEECARLNIRMIPKGLADFVPITIGAPAVPALAVLIDDDAMVHMNWEDAAERAGVELKAFKTPAKFLANLEAFPKDTPIYIDSELGEDIKGEDIAVDLKDKGFTNLRLATGHPPENFSHLPWLKVTGKESPWRT